MIYIYCLNNNIVEGYDLLQNCIGVYEPQYSACSKTCGGGEQELKIDVTEDPVSGFFNGNWQDAEQCPPDLIRECNTHNCPIDCKYVRGDDGWGDWIKNLDSNGKQIGTETRTREILVNEINNGTPCGKVTETRNHDVDCVQSAWSTWGACSRSCGGGTKTRTRSTLQEKKNGGQSCEPSSDITSCNIDNCPINCEGDWHWVGCASSNRLKQYKVTRNSAHKGKSCPVPDKKVSWVAGACYRSCARSGRCGPSWKRRDCCKEAGAWLPK